jgi:hypothetical protein
MTRRRKWLIAAVVAAFAAAGGTALAALTAAHGTGMGNIEVVTQTSPSTTGSQTFVNVPGASVTIAVGDGHYIRSRFSGESLCGGEGSVGAKCSMRVVVAGVGASNPNSGLDFAFDSLEVCCSTDPTPEAHSMEWISNKLAAGTYTVRAQYAVEIGGMSFTLDDWTFSVEDIVAAPLS